MLAPARRPFNPNRSSTEVTGWNSGDLSAFLSEVNTNRITGTLNNDVKISNKNMDYYQTAPKRELVAEIISTFNINQLKLLDGIYHIQKCNDRIISSIKNKNKSFNQLNNKIKHLEARQNTLYSLLFKAMHPLPGFTTLNNESPHLKSPKLIANQQQAPPIKPRIDTTIVEPTHPTINGSSEQTIELETTQSKSASENSHANMRVQINLLNEPQSNHNTINKITTTTTTDTIDESHINPFDEIHSKNSLTKSSVITPDTNKIAKPQLKLKNKNNKPKIKIISTPIKSANPCLSNILQTKQQSNTIAPIQSNKITTVIQRSTNSLPIKPQTRHITNKIKKKKKKIKYKNNNKRNKKQRNKQQKSLKHSGYAVSNDCTSMTMPYIANKQRQQRIIIINPIREDIDMKTRYGIYCNSKSFEKQLLDILPYEEYIKDEQRAYDELNQQINYAVFNR